MFLPRDETSDTYCTLDSLVKHDNSRAGDEMPPVCPGDLYGQPLSMCGFLGIVEVEEEVEEDRVVRKIKFSKESR